MDSGANKKAKHIRAPQEPAFEGLFEDENDHVKLTIQGRVNEVAIRDLLRIARHQTLTTGAMDILLHISKEQWTVSYPGVVLGTAAVSTLQQAGKERSSQNAQRCLQKIGMTGGTVSRILGPVHDTDNH